MAVNITNVDMISSGQFDVFYNSSVLNVRSPYPAAGQVNDTYDRTAYGNPATGCGWQSVGTVSVGGIEVGNGTDTRFSGCFRYAWYNDWCQASTGDCGGGDGTGQTGEGWLTIVHFNAVRTGTCNIAFGGGPGGGKLQVNQILDSATYQDYSYTGIEHLIWGANVSVTVK